MSGGSEARRVNIRTTRSFELAPGPGRARAIARTVALVATLCAAGLVLPSIMPGLDKLELSTIDLRMRRYPGPFDQKASPIVIVDIGDDSYNALHAIYPWSRSYYARLIRNLNRAGAKLIVIDIVLSKAKPDQPGGDDSLAQVLSEYGNVILAGKTNFESTRFFLYGRATAGPSVSVSTEPPYEAFRSDDPLNWGLADVREDPDNVVRTYITARAAHDGARVVPTLSMLAFDRLTGTSFDTTTAETSFRIAYPGGARTFLYRPFYQVVDDATLWTKDEAEWEEETNWFDSLLAEGVFDDKVVFVGASVHDLHDVKYTPFSGTADSLNALMPGVEVHAAALHTLLTGREIRQARPWMVRSILVGISIGLFLVGAIAPVWLYALVVSAAIAAWWVGSYRIFGASQVIVPIWSATVTMMLVMSLQLAVSWWREQNRRRQVTGMFGHYVAPEVVKQLVRDPTKARLSGERRELTVLFCDVEGFTTICENLPAEKVVELLNEYLDEMTPIVKAQGGIIDKFEGDLIMAEFGIPLAVPDHALRACRTAFDMQKRLKELRERWREQARPELKSRVGIGTGQMLFGNMGSSDSFDFTVVGDIPNLASRLEGANKSYGTRIMINERAAEMVSDEMFVREMDLLVVKGRQQPEKCFQLMAPMDSPKANEIRRVIELFGEAQQLYRNQQWDEAIARFEQVLSIWADDEPSRVFVERCRQFRQAPPGSDWNGVFTMTTK